MELWSKHQCLCCVDDLRNCLEVLSVRVFLSAVLTQQRCQGFLPGRWNEFEMIWQVLGTACAWLFRVSHVA